MKKNIFVTAIMLIGVNLSINAQINAFKVEGFSYIERGIKEVDIEKVENKSSKLVIPSNVTYNGITYKVNSIQDDVLKEDSIITVLSIPDRFSVKGAAFWGAKKLEEIHLGDTIELRDACFGCCMQLKKVVFRGKLYGRLEEAFGWTPSTMQRGFYFVSSTPPTVIMRNNFHESVYKQVTLYVPANSVENYKHDSVWGKFKIEVWEPDKVQ